MNLEFPDNSIKKIAQLGDKKWLICINCVNAWENSDQSIAMVVVLNAIQNILNKFKSPIFG